MLTGKVLLGNRFGGKVALALGVLFLGGYASAALAGPSTTVTAFAPGKAGTVTLKLFVWADPNGRHGVPCTVNVNIPAGITAQQKAALIQAAINASNCGVSTKRVGNTVKITAKDGVDCTYAKDDTNEIMLVDNEDEGVPVEYTTLMSLSGETTDGLLEFGENGIFHGVPTGGMPIPKIYEALREMFGEGEVTDRGFQLPPRFTDVRSFGFNVTDPGLTIEVWQEPRREGGIECELIRSFKAKCKRGKLKASIKSDLPGGTELTLVLEDGTSKVVTLNRRGKGKAKWTGQRNRTRRICIAECEDHCVEARCN